MPDERRINPGNYRLAQLAARAKEGALSQGAAREILRHLDTYARRLEQAVRALGVDPSDERLIQQARIFREAAQRLERATFRATRMGREVAFSEIEEIWREAGLDAARQKQVPDALMGAVRRPPVSLLGAYEQIGASGWKTLVRHYTQQAVQEADEIVKMAISEGVNSEVLARRLRPYVLGAETFEKAFNGLPVDLRKLSDPGLRHAARNWNYNARRIAASELHNARAEAEVQHFAADPLVRAVAWRLAPDRGPTARADECDVLAHSDFFGLGAGIYPVDSVPVTPHPFDKCERVPLVRSVRDAGLPKPTGMPRVSAIGIGKLPGRVSKAEADRIRLRAEKLMALTDSRRPDVGPLLPGGS